MLRSRIAWLAGGLAAALASAGVAYRIGYDRGAERASWAQIELQQVTCATAAFAALGYLRAGDPPAAMATLDATIDAGISAHWLRIQRPEIFAESSPSGADLLPMLVEYRRSHPSSASDQTPQMDRRVAEYLAYLDSGGS